MLTYDTWYEQLCSTSVDYFNREAVFHFSVHDVMYVKDEMQLLTFLYRQ